MSAAVVFFITETMKILLSRLANAGKFNSLTEDEARAMVASISASLDEHLPSPGDLEKA